MSTYASPGNPLAPFITPNVAGNLINPISRRVMSFYPLPNTGGTPGTTSYNPYANFYATGSNIANNNQYDLKLDSRFTDNDQLSIRFSQQWGNSLGANLFGNALDANTQGPNSGVSYSGAVNYNHIFSPTTLLTVTVGYDHNWSNTAGLYSTYPNVTLESLGFSTSVANQLRQSGFLALPAFNLDQYAKENGNASIGGQPFSGLLYGRDVYHFIGSVGHTVRGHDLHIGAEFRVHRINFAQFGEPAGLFAFGQGGTSNYQSVGGDSMATFLTGFANNWSAYENPVTPATQNLQYGGFIQDNWHVSDRLTLNLGVRYDIDKPRTERYNQMSFFDPNAPSPLAGVPGVPATGSIEYVGQNGYGRAPYQTYYGAIGPRGGFAYRIGTNWTVRGGYGLYYDASKYGAAGTGSGGGGFLGFTSNPTFPSYNNNFNWVPGLVLGQSLNIPPKTGNSLGVNTNLGGTVPTIPVYNFNTLPQEQTWSFGIQRQLPWGVLTDFEYVGRKGTHLYLGGDTYALNHLPESAANAYRTNPAAFNAFVPIPTALASAVQARTAPGSNGLWNGTWPAYNAFLPYPQYPLGVFGQTGLQNVDPPIGNSIYHAFQMRIEKHMTQGLQFLFTYSAQKSIDNSSVAGSGVYINGYSGATLASIQDPNHLNLERSISAFDISQVAQITGLLQLPFGRGKTFGSGWNRWVDGLLGGWQINGIYRWDSGLPLLIFLQGGTSLPTYGSQRPNLPYQLSVNSVVGPNTNYFTNPQVGSVTPGSAWMPLPYYDGNAPRVLPNVRQQGTNNVSASLFKSFNLGFREGARLELRGEAFNLLNSVQFGAPNTTVGSGTFGAITSQANLPRQIQVAAKLYF
jgi:TonB dependent receptor